MPAVKEANPQCGVKKYKYEHFITFEPNAVNLRLSLIHVGAAFQPRLSDYGHRATFISRLESRSHEELI